MEYLVVQCPYCGGFLACPARLKTKTCPYCGRRFQLARARIVARARSGREAGEIVRRIKAKGAKYAFGIWRLDARPGQGEAGASRADDRG